MDLDRNRDRDRDRAREGASADGRSPPISDSDATISDTEAEAEEEQDIAVFEQYGGGGDGKEVGKVRGLIAASRGGAISCLICLGRVRWADAVWTCTKACHTIMHLQCVQQWATQACKAAVDRARSRTPLLPPPPSPCWHCPKCRAEYPYDQIPRRYRCFCAKVEDPPADPWLTPHTCGQTCGRSHQCGHMCVLLCHPGPCPPCPKLIRLKCFCGAHADVRRCRGGVSLGAKEDDQEEGGFSCGGECGRQRMCGHGRCVAPCHAGECPPCAAPAPVTCQCGSVQRPGTCAETGFRCDEVCGRFLPCGKHRCDKGCHLPGDCGECPLQLQRQRGNLTCPCGKAKFSLENAARACDVSPPSCGSTCDKLLCCGRHRCPERCHHGPCLHSCLVSVTKVCRCGSLKKQVPCHQNLVCERKCQRLRDCGRHACKRRCCDGDCPPCSEVCGRKLRCNNHKCPAPCHRGVCAPCPITVRICCFCEGTSYEVPCGAEKGLKPPKCRRTCTVAPVCGHGPRCKPHRCHYGPCPPCELTCDEELPCGHKCKERCHGPRPPPNREFTLKTKKRKSLPVANGNLGHACPPCKELVERECVGRHLGGERMMICSQNIPFRCGNYCSNLLSCGNHFCKKPCHLIASDGVGNGIIGDMMLAEECDECNLPCQKKRMPPCPHPCPQKCHPRDCGSCKVHIKRACHCGTMVHVFECSQVSHLAEEEQQRIRSCNGPCHRKLPNCTHLCAEICHPGSCPSPELCRKKVVVRCSCQRLKKEWICLDVQSAYRKRNCCIKDIPKGMFGLGILPCDDVCSKLCEEKKAQSDLHQRKQLHSEGKEDKISHISRRRKRHEQLQIKSRQSTLQEIFAKVKNVLLVVMLVLLAIALMYFGYKSLFWLSDWMDRLDERRAMSRRNRI